MKDILRLNCFKTPIISTQGNKKISGTNLPKLGLKKQFLKSYRTNLTNTKTKNCVFPLLLPYLFLATLILNTSAKLQLNLNRAVVPNQGSTKDFLGPKKIFLKFPKAFSTLFQDENVVSSPIENIVLSLR